MLSKPKRPRMGVREIEPTVFNQHRRFVRSCGYVVPGCRCRDIEFAHLRTAANASKGNKPHDGFAIGLCGAHHSAAHQVGHDTFARANHIDLWRIAAELVTRSPDRKMRESFERLPAHLQGLLFPERLAA
jgi:hypothetical protein